MFGRDRLWSAGTIRYPPGAIVEGGRLVASNMIRLRGTGIARADRSLSSGAVKLAGTGGTGGSGGDEAQLGPATAPLDIVATKDDGTILLDLTTLFDSDIPGYSAVPQIGGTDIISATVDPSRSFIADARAFGDNLYIR